jgi:hypothetical protein
MEDELSFEVVAGGDSECRKRVFVVPSSGTRVTRVVRRFAEGRGRFGSFRALLARRFRAEERLSGRGFSCSFRLGETLSEDADGGGVILSEGREEDAFRTVVGEAGGVGNEEPVEDVDVGGRRKGSAERGNVEREKGK